jgi:hypothetical protein
VYDITVSDRGGSVPKILTVTVRRAAEPTAGRSPPLPLELTARAQGNTAVTVVAGPTVATSTTVGGLIDLPAGSAQTIMVRACVRWFVLRPSPTSADGVHRSRLATPTATFARRTTT